MTFLGYVFTTINLAFWLLSAVLMVRRKPGDRVSSWTAGEIKFVRSLSWVIVVLGASVLLGACGGGDDRDQHKHDPSPNCAMRPETCK